INYKPVHDLLKTLEMTPYLRSDITFKQLLEQYRPWLIIALVVFIILIFFLLKIKNFNIQLEAKVKERTKSLLQANKKLHELAEIDELTGATSRREFFALTSHAFDLSKRNHTGLILLALDIDFFKHVNDTYGHPIGDEVLKLFSRTIQKILRRSDLFGRVGGEEFTIALQNIPMHDALILAEKIRYAIEHTPYVIDKEGSVHFSVSIGVSTLEDDDKSLSELIKRSDNALYLAKEEGRNCIRQL
ncbi:MAG: GGDEF domain-containing protein, partial [Campylobacterota bacterium]|nr:GGDEF domain-containing protein [Campylobacterota bacterium]